MSLAMEGMQGWDRQGLAATWILASPIFGRGQGRYRIDRYIDFEEHSIDFPTVLEQPWSSGERLMIEAAYDLFNGNVKVGLDELVSTLDDGNLRIVLDAIRIRRGWRPER